MLRQGGRCGPPARYDALWSSPSAANPTHGPHHAKDHQTGRSGRPAPGAYVARVAGGAWQAAEATASEGRRADSRNRAGGSDRRCDRRRHVGACENSVAPAQQGCRSNRRPDWRASPTRSRRLQTAPRQDALARYAATRDHRARAGASGAAAATARGTKCRQRRSAPVQAHGRTRPVFAPRGRRLDRQRLGARRRGGRRHARHAGVGQFTHRHRPGRDAAPGRTGDHRAQQADRLCLRTGRRRPHAGHDVDQAGNPVAGGSGAEQVQEQPTCAGSRRPGGWISTRPG